MRTRHDITLYLHFLFSYFKAIDVLCALKVLGDIAKHICLSPSEGLKIATGRRPWNSWIIASATALLKVYALGHFPFFLQEQINFKTSCNQH